MIGWRLFINMLRVKMPKYNIKTTKYSENFEIEYNKIKWPKQNKINQFS